MERIRPDGGHAGGDDDARQGRAAMERIRPDGGHAGGDVHGGKGRAAVERPFPDGGHAGGDGHRCNVRTIIILTITNNRCSLRDIEMNCPQGDAGQQQKCKNVLHHAIPNVNELIR